MAATRLIALHINKGKSVARCLADRTEYAENPDKTDGGELVSTFACDAETADEEFLLSKRQYQHITGRQQAHDVIAYQLRQSFKPGEITPDEANQVGYETAMRFLKGKHAFIVATHVDRAHIHNHIIFNSTTLDCTHKFKNFFLSAYAVQRLSDMVCLEHGLSVIEPKPYRERTKRTMYPHRKSQRDILCECIDQILATNPRTFSDFTQGMANLGFEFKDGKYPAFRYKEQKRFIRLRSLDEEYSEEALRAEIAGRSVRKKSRTAPEAKSFNMLIDIQAKLAEGKAGGYERWAKKYNRKEAARTVCLLKEKGIENYDDLVALTERLSARHSELSDVIKKAEKRMAEISALQTHISNYAKTKKIYDAYRQSGFHPQFFETHREALLLHKAAKDAFNKLEGKKIPSRQALIDEYHCLLTQKKEAYTEYRQNKKEMQEYLIAKHTVESILGIDRKKQEEQQREEEEKQQTER